MSRDPAIILPRAILFDMDGTLTQPMLDFPRIKAEMGIGSRPILEALAEMNAEQRAHAESVLHRHEEEAAAMSALNPGCRELLDCLNSRNIRSALITRNSRRSVQTVLDRHGLKLDVLITREDPPPKPHPQPLLHACRHLQVEVTEAWMVGDGQYDIEAGIAAGVRTVWVNHGRCRDFEAVPWREATDLPEVMRMLYEKQNQLSRTPRVV